jgi:GT2 family glycosyltransferase
LDADTLLAPDGLAQAMPATADALADWIYTDDDHLDDKGRRVDPNLKGDFSPELALADDYATRLAVVRRRAIEQAGGLESHCGQAQIYSLLLRIAARGGAIRHVAEVACHRLRATASVLGPHHRAAAQQLLAEHGVAASIELERRKSPPGFDLQNIVWPRDVLTDQQITILIPTRDRVDLLSRCIDSLRKTVNLCRVQLLILDDESQEEETRRYLERLATDKEVRCRIVRRPREDSFSYARLMNAGARQVDTEFMLHLNNDIEAISPGWLDRMAGWLVIRDVGVVGAKLLYPDGSIQHAGVIVSPALGAPGHLFNRLNGTDRGYQWLAHRVRNVSAVTGACLLTRTALFHDLGGFDEEHFGVQFNDTDFCLRLIRSGKRVVYEPAAILFHYESASRGKGYDYKETLYFLEKYRTYRDPFTSPWIDPASLYGPTPLVVS